MIINFAFPTSAITQIQAEIEKKKGGKQRKGFKQFRFQI